MKFHKFSATGNDFILIDNRNAQPGRQPSQLARDICRRRLSVGADGILFIDSSADCDFRLSYINADGSHTECGNGARAAAHYVSHNGSAKDHLVFDFGKHKYEAEVRGSRVKLRMPGPTNPDTDLNILEEPNMQEGGAVDTGVPHYVIFGREIGNADMCRIGRQYRFHNRFQPEGVNVDLVELISPNEIAVRTYERGVEDETYSCGTGCVASAYISHVRYQTSFPIKIRTAGGELYVHRDSNEAFYLDGKVTRVFEGVLLDAPSERL